MAVVRRRREVACHMRWRSVVTSWSVRRVGWVAHWVSVARVSRVLVVGAVMRVRRRCVHRTRRRPRARVRWVAIARTSIHGRLLVRGVSVARRAHRSASDGRNGALLVNSRFRVHALLRADMAKLRVVRRLHEVLRLLRRARVVADEMQVLAVVGGD